MSTLTLTKPFLKWVGGKSQILDQVLRLFPKEINNYHEPFLGGGSVLLGFLSAVKSGSIKLSGKVFASDYNKALIGLYKNIQEFPEELIAEVKSISHTYASIKGTEVLPTSHKRAGEAVVPTEPASVGIVNRKPANEVEAKTSQESYYYWIRSLFNTLLKDKEDMSDYIEVSAMFLFLNKTCFRGVYREGPNGFNVPFEKIQKNQTILDEDHIRQVSVLIKDVVFTHASFEESLKKVVSSRDFIYMDPPYAPESDTSFVSYTKDGFGEENHKLLFRTCSEFQKKGVKLVMSNHDVKVVRDAFPSPPFSTQVISCRRAINSKNPEAKTNEVLISN